MHVLFLVLAALALDRPLTGVTADWSQFRRGATSVCEMAVVDPADGMLLGGTCRDLTAAERRKLRFDRPKATAGMGATLADGRRLRARIVPIPEASHGPSVTGCLGTADHPCRADPSLDLMPRGTTLQLVAVARDGGETILAHTDDTAREVKELYLSPDRTKVLLVFTSARMPRDVPEHTGLDVLGVDVSARLRPR